MCMAWLLSLFGCGKRKPIMVDGPGMERQIWSAFTITRCDERFETIYSYTVKYDADADTAYIYEGQEEACIQLRPETISELMNLDLLSMPDAEPVDGNFLALTVFDAMSQARPKNISSEKEEEILALLATYLEELKEEPTMLDGPDMEYQSPWTQFHLSRTDSNTRYIFWFTVTKTDEGALVTGSCQDQDGRNYETETGIPISEEDLATLRLMDLDQLPDEELWPEDLERPTDLSEITLTLTFSDGTEEKKDASGELSMEIYELLLPYLKNI